MVTDRFVSTHATQHSALVAALAAACAWCAEPPNREPLAELLSDARYLDIPARTLAPALTGRFDCGHGRVETVPDFHVFHGGDANVPTLAKATALQAELTAAGLLAAATLPPQLPRRLFREDLPREALKLNPPHCTTTTK